MWRLVLNGVATYSEIENQWDIELVFQANQVLSYQQKIEAEMQRRAEA